MHRDRDAAQVAVPRLAAPPDPPTPQGIVAAAAVLATPQKRSLAFEWPRPVASADRAAGPHFHTSPHLQRSAELWSTLYHPAPQPPVGRMVPPSAEAARQVLSYL